MDFFSTFAECSITFAGFAAVHGVLQGSASPRGMLRSFSTILPGMNTFLLALLPVLLLDEITDTQYVWQLVSWVGFVAASFQLFMMYWLHHKLNRLGYPAQAPIAIRIAQAACLIAMALMLYNALTAQGALLFGAALLLQILQGVLALLHSFWLAMKLELEKT